MIYRIGCLFLSLLLVAGCQSLGERKQADALQEVLRNYEAVIRWGNLDQASHFLRPEAASKALRKPDRELRVTHYEVVQGPSVVEKDKAIQTAVIQYVYVETQVVREIVDRQTWQFDPLEERWYLISSQPRFD
ncbi:MAG: asparagine synthetase [Candidatus Thiodiazotropha sp.]